ncbi:hypothetical protein N9B22_00210 [bacterium]|nr:hypothetical protein [bacterium]MDA7928549.1 hypothetical protein [Mariniblastus sp.]
MISSNLKTLLATFFIGIALSQSGCHLAVQERGFLEDSGGEDLLSSNKLRVLIDDFTLRYASHIEQTSDQILAQAPSTHVRRNALLWKINGINATFRASARKDPMGAFLDLWILVKQTDDLFDRESNALFGSFSLAQLNGHGKFNDRLLKIQKTIGKDLPKLNDNIELGESFAADFAANFPIDNLQFDRESATSHYIAAVKEKSHETMEVLGRLESNVDELQGLVRLYAEFLPKQARWQAELLSLDVIEMSPLTDSLANLKQTTLAAQAISQTVEQLPALVDHERQSIEIAINEQREKTVAQIEAMRLNTIDQLQQERRIVLESVNQERVIATEDLKQQLDKTLASVDQLSKKRTEEAALYGEGLLILAINEAKQTLAVASVFAGFFILFTGWLFTRKPKHDHPNSVNFYSHESSQANDGYFKRAG